EMKWKDGKLHNGSGPELVAVAAGQFEAGDVKFYFEKGSPIRMRVVTPDDETTYERFEPAHPTAVELAALTGKYESDETRSTLTFAVDQQSRQLTMQIASNDPVPLRPTFRDGFHADVGEIHFIRDAAGAVTSLSASDGRSWDLRFNRVR
ncbi:MAG: hypothetical protein JO022_10055, partial [Acidobacteriaceae bacterium]|nr:hypothetical protein [Acidobacteriaceae bacterium]